MYTYTEESVGGHLICQLPGGMYSTHEELNFDDNLVSINVREKDGMVLILVFKKTNLIKIISSKKLKFEQFETSNYYKAVFEPIEE